MRNKMILVYSLGLLYVASIFSAAQATDLFEPYLKVYGTIRPVVVSKRGDSLSRAKINMNRIFLNIDKGFCEEKFGFHTLTEYQEGEKGEYPHEWWLEEGYVYFRPGFGTIKAGNVYTPFGILWDNTFYSSLVYYKGYMGDPDYGLVFEKTEKINNDLDLAWSTGYFIREDGLNGETATGQGYEFLSDSGERNTFVARLNPRIKAGEKSSFELGLSVLAGKVRSTNAKRQVAFEADGVYKYGPLTLTGECVIYDKAYSHKEDTLKGYVYYLEPSLCIYDNPDSRFLKGITLNYNYSRDNPDSGQGLGSMHLPSIKFKFSDIFKTEFLYVDWTQDATTVDRSWWLIFYLDY